MLRKRIIGVVVVKDGWAVQSFGYGRYLPLGRPECLVENLDRWGVDEIGLMCIDRSRKGAGPDLTVLDKIGRLGIATPLIYGGGIASAADALQAIQAGADRICVDALLHDSPASVISISERAGAQAVIACLPLRANREDVLWLDYRNGREGRISDEVMSLFRARVVSEAMLVDWRHEGMPRGFDDGLVSGPEFADVPLLAFGGISEREQVSRLLSRPNVVAVAVGNFLSYREHAVQALKFAGDEIRVRAALYRVGR